MEQAASVPVWQRVVALTSRALLAAYLLAMVLLAAAVATGRAALSPLAVGYLIVPAIAFGQAVFTSVRSRRADDPARARELASHSGIQAGIGVVFSAHLIALWWRASESWPHW